MLREIALAAGCALMLGSAPIHAEEPAEHEATVEVAAEESAPQTSGSTGKEEKKIDPVSWSKGLTFKSADGQHSLTIGNRVQVRFTQNEPDEGDGRGSFRIRRAKLALSGQVFEDWKYKIQAVWSGGSTTLEDAYFQYTENPMAQFWLGQGKVFFGRQELTSSGSQQFVDRSAVSDRFAHSRDQGIALIGVNESKTFEYNIGLYNGNGRNASTNDDDDYLTAARIVWTPFGEYKLEESSLDYPENGKLALGIAALQNTEDAGTVDITRYNVEFAYKIRGFNTVAEYYTEEADPVGGGATVDTDGWYAQLGYLFPNKKFELAGRHGVISPDLPGNVDQTETGVAASYYFSKHSYKVQGDFRQLEDDLRGTDSDEFRLQLQIAF
jgi:phosphate-selective porin